MTKFPARAKIPWNAVTDRRLRGYDLRILALLSMLAGEKGWAKASQVKMDKMLRVSRGTVYRSLNRLAATGYIERRNRTKVGGRTVHHPFSPHTFHINWEGGEE
jgi:predicted transcriptional regulator